MSAGHAIALRSDRHHARPARSTDLDVRDRASLGSDHTQFKIQLLIAEFVANSMIEWTGIRIGNPDSACVVSEAVIEPLPGATVSSHQKEEHENGN